MGETILDGRYRIDNRIAQGGMSTVYKAYDLKLRRDVAAKILDDRSPSFQKRFHREAQAMAQLSSPNLINIFDIGDNYLIMELSDGGTLRELLNERGPMPPHAAAEVIRCILKGLEVIHNAGMVHRDIKPDNVLINQDHQVKLTDFGLIHLGAENSITRTGDHVLGTVDYMSPEQVSGENVTAASDIYSLGCCLYELLTGEVPFPAPEAIRRAYMRLENPVPTASSVIEGIPEEFDEMIATATAMDPQDRYADATEFLADLNQICEELHLPRFRVPAPTRAAAYQAISSDLPTQHIHRVAESDAPTTVLKEAETQYIPPVHNETQIQPALVHNQEEREKPYIPSVSNHSPLRITLWILCIAALTIAVAIGGWWFGSGRYGEIPNLVGMSQAQAAEQLENAGYKSSFINSYDDSIPANQVARVEPNTTHYPRGKTVTVVMSLGKPTVPNATGSVDSYYQALAERTLIPSEQEDIFSDSVPVGGIAKTDPAAGTAVNTGSTVNIYLSKGPAPVTIPSVAGMDEDKARSVLENLGLSVASSTEKIFSDEYEKDTVAGTYPEEGTEVSRGTQVHLQVSNAIRLPDLSGKTVEEATDILKDLGLKVGSQTVGSELGNSATSITQTYPQAGTLMDPNHPSVDIVLAGKVRVPNLIGKKLSDARQSITDLGLSISSSSNRSQSRVWYQSPAPGTIVDITRDTTVEVDTIG